MSSRADRVVYQCIAAALILVGIISLTVHLKTDQPVDHREAHSASLTLQGGTLWINAHHKIHGMPSKLAKISPTHFSRHGTHVRIYSNSGAMATLDPHSITLYSKDIDVDSHLECRGNFTSEPCLVTTDDGGRAHYGLRLPTANTDAISNALALQIPYGDVEVYANSHSISFSQPSGKEDSAVAFDIVRAYPTDDSVFIIGKTDTRRAALFLITNTHMYSAVPSKGDHGMGRSFEDRMDSYGRCSGKKPPTPCVVGTDLLGRTTVHSIINQGVAKKKIISGLPMAKGWRLATHSFMRTPTQCTHCNAKGYREHVLAVLFDGKRIGLATLDFKSELAGTVTVRLEGHQDPALTELIHINQEDTSIRFGPRHIKLFGLVFDDVPEYIEAALDDVHMFSHHMSYHLDAKTRVANADSYNDLSVSYGYYDCAFDGKFTGDWENGYRPVGAGHTDKYLVGNPCHWYAAHVTGDDTLED